VSYEIAARELLTDGIARIRLGSREASGIAAARAAAVSFFNRSTEWKRAHGDPDGVYGYRPYGTQFSDDPNLPDECESFAYWADRADLIPGREELVMFMTTLARYWKVAARVTSHLLAGLASYYGYADALETGLSSCVEISAYGVPPAREFLLARHEDGDLVTLATPNLPGLEVERGGVMRPEPCDGDSLVILPGSLLTAMTGGQIQPLYRQVRNHMLPGRVTVKFGVSTPVCGSIAPYVRNPANAGVDMAELAMQNCALSGKPPPHLRPAR
jgi:isopenicillin N synthase-like dioxygenase